MRRIRSFAVGALLTGLLLAPVEALAGGLSFVEFEQAPIPPALNGLRGALALAISADGLNVYTVGIQDNAVTVWDRDPITNAITFNEVEEDSVGGVDGMRDPQGVAVSPDGACVYVATRDNEPGPTGPGTVVSFSRNLITGALTFVGFLEDNAGGVDGIDTAIDVTVSPNSAHVYVAGEADNGIGVFSQIGCALTFVETEKDTIGGVLGLRTPQKLAISADGQNVYAGARISDGKDSFGTVVVFSRNNITGALTFLEFQQDGVAGVDRLAPRVEGLAVSPDGNHVYAGSSGGDSVVVFARGITGALTWVETERRTGLARGFKVATGVAVSPDNRYVYVVGRGDDAIAVFARDTTSGELDFLEFQDDPVPGTTVLGRTEDVVASPDGRGVYVVSAGSDTLTAWAVDVCGNGSVGIDEQCDDGCGAGTPGVCEPADDGDGCSSVCRLELCTPTPTGTCHAATPFGGAQLQIKDQSVDRKDQLKWKWKGQATTLAQFGNPVATASYVICIYDSSINPQPLLSKSAPAGGICNEKPCWVAKSTSYQYGDKFLTPDGVKKVQLKEGLVDGKPQVQVQGIGIFIDPPVLPLTLPVTVQVKNSQNSECWEAVYSVASKNDPAQFKAKSD